MFHLGMYLVGGGSSTSEPKSGGDPNDLSSYTPEAILALKTALRQKEERIFQLTNDFSDKEQALLSEIKRLKGSSALGQGSAGKIAPPSIPSAQSESLNEQTGTDLQEPVVESSQSETAQSSHSSPSKSTSDSHSSSSSFPPSSSPSKAVDTASANTLAEEQDHELQAALSQHQAHILQLQEALQERDGHVMHLQEALQERDAHIEELDARIDQISSVQGGHQEAVDELRNVISEREQELSELRSVQESVAPLRNLISQQEEDLAELRSEKQLAEERTQSMEARIQELETRLQETEQQLRMALDKQSVESESRSEEDQEEVLQLRQALTDAQAQCEEARRESKSQSEQVLRLQKGMKEMGARMTALKSKSQRMAQLSKAEIQRLHGVIQGQGNPRAGEQQQMSQPALVVVAPQNPHKTSQPPKGYDFGFNSAPRPTSGVAAPMTVQSGVDQSNVIGGVDADFSDEPTSEDLSCFDLS
eukprot:gb/GEZN01006566.1/.p1 GENE.gb/GEZN01006566.1/~~gb/GEZN01006566.1/.p1  ORF type:complete len:477 (-),score=95.21 gb/GEZN01006566.1/:30-1460(-)